MRFRIDTAPIPARRFRLPLMSGRTLMRRFPRTHGLPRRCLRVPTLPIATAPGHPSPALNTEADTCAEAPSAPYRLKPQRTTTPEAPAGFRDLRAVYGYEAAGPPSPGRSERITDVRVIRRHDLSLLPRGARHEATGARNDVSLRQHNDDDPVGRVLSLQHVQDRTGAWSIFGQAEIADIPRGKETLAELRTGARLGVSPAFLIREIDFDDDFNMQVKQSEVYELSLVTGPRFYGARVLSMEASMSTTNGKVHNVVTTSDLVGLSLAAGRKILDSSTGSAAQRAKLREFFEAFDSGLASGLTRDAAATAAKLVSGI